MARRAWLQYERSQRAPNRCQPSAAPPGREEPAQRASTLLSSREENGEDRRWPAAIHLDRFRLAEASAVMTNLAAYRSRVSIDTTSFRMVALGMATSLDNAIPRKRYLFGASWPHVC